MKRDLFRMLAATATAAILATSLAACGSDDDKKDDSGSSDSSSALTKDEWVTQANAICKAQDQAEADSFGAAQTALQSGDDAALKEALTQGVTVIRGEADAIAALEAPDEIKSDADALVASLNDALDAIESDGATAINGLAAPSEKAQALGLTECGN